MKIEKILAGIDLGSSTEIVLAYALFLARTMRASVDLLYVIDYLITPPAYLLPYMEEEKRAAEKKLRGLKEKHFPDDIKTETKVTVGRLHESFEAAVKKTQADILVLGFMYHALRRSSSEKLIKGLQMPMIVVRGEKAEQAKKSHIKISRILCPTDFSDASGKALNIAMELQEKMSAKLDILHVCPNYRIKKMQESPDREKAIQEMRDKAVEKFDVFLHDFGIKESGIIDEGEPHSRIAAFAAENDIDLIVMGARGLGLLKGMLIGSVTDAVLKSSPCPVLIIH
jgi:nucleotide-binding universal stress UspA family protein